MNLAGRKIIITGGARGIGEATARGYAVEGADVALLDVLHEAGEKVVAEVMAEGRGSARYFPCDVTDKAMVDETFAVAVSALGGLDVLANIAGVERHSPAEEISEDELNLIFDVNVKGTVFTNQAAFVHMKDNGGRILNFGSDAALVAYTNGAHYSASKGAVTSWTRTIAGEWGRYGITANTMVPAMWTPMYDEHRATMNEDELAAHDVMMQGLIPIGGKLGDAARDLVPMMVFLAGDGAQFITGQILSVNGGLNYVR